VFLQAGALPLRRHPEKGERMKGTYRIAYEWAVRCFGREHVHNRRMRALRLLEEAAELAQAVGVEKDKSQAVLDVVYSRPAGLPSQELGGVYMTAHILCAAFEKDPEEIFEAELNRVLAKPVEHFTRRNQEKVDLGLHCNEPAVIGAG
jgi:NTP pyrophosphatase (non-canonical NTP hydrolase)